MDELLSYIPSGAVMAFLLMAASVYLILQIAREDAKYPIGLRRFLLWLAWPIFIISLFVFLGIFFVALLPILQGFSIEFPKINLDPSLFIFYSFVLIFSATSSAVSVFVWRKMHDWLPKSKTDRALEETLHKNVNKMIDMVKQSQDIAEESRNMVEESSKLGRKYIDDTDEFMKKTKKLLEPVVGFVQLEEKKQKGKVTRSRKTKPRPTQKK
jgi:hypothetical protein